MKVIIDDNTKFINNNDNINDNLNNINDNNDNNLNNLNNINDEYNKSQIKFNILYKLLKYLSILVVSIFIIYLIVLIKFKIDFILNEQNLLIKNINNVIKKASDIVSTKDISNINYNISQITSFYFLILLLIIVLIIIVILILIPLSKNNYCLKMIINILCFIILILFFISLILILLNDRHLRYNIKYELGNNNNLYNDYNIKCEYKLITERINGRLIQLYKKRSDEECIIYKHEKFNEFINDIIPLNNISIFLIILLTFPFIFCCYIDIVYN